MKDNEITSFDKELNEFLQPKCLIIQEGAVTKQPLKLFKKLLVDYMKSTNNFFVFLSKKGPEGPFSLV